MVITTFHRAVDIASAIRRGYGEDTAGAEPLAYHSALVPIAMMNHRSPRSGAGKSTGRPSASPNGARLRSPIQSSHGVLKPVHGMSRNDGKDISHL